MSDSITEVSHEGWLSRLMGSIKGVLVGIVLFLVGFPMLWWNEGRAVQTYNSLMEGSGSVVSVAYDSVDAGNDNKLVHVTGQVSTTETLEDKTFGVSVAGGLRLTRSVEMFQWKEHKNSKTEKKVGGGTKTTTTYEYKQEWGDADSVKDSSGFKEPTGHSNPKPAFTDRSSQADRVTFGGFTLNAGQVGSLSKWDSLQVTQENFNQLGGMMQRKLKVADGYYYMGANPSSPVVGDLKIRFKVIKPHDISVIAQQVGKTFQAYQTKAGDKLEMLSTGVKTAKEMFDAAQAANTMLTWFLRFLGFILMFLGVKMIFEPLVVVADVIPFLGNVLSYGTGMFAFAIAGFFSFLTIALAWFAYRPMLSIFLVAVAIGCVVLAKKMAGGGGPPPIPGGGSAVPPPIPGGDGPQPPPIPGA